MTSEDLMDAIRIETVVESDGELHFTDLPYRRGDHVEAVIVLHGEPRGREQELARQRFLERARRSLLCSTATSPSRDALHERD